LVNRWSGKLSRGNLQGHTPWVLICHKPRLDWLRNLRGTNQWWWWCTSEQLLLGYVFAWDCLSTESHRLLTCTYIHNQTHTQRDFRAQPCILYSRLVHVCMHACTHAYTYTRTRCTHACTHARTHIHTRTHTHAHTHTHTYTHRAPRDIGLGMTSNGGSRTRLTRLRGVEFVNRDWWVVSHYCGKINFWF